MVLVAKNQQANLLPVPKHMNIGVSVDLTKRVGVEMESLQVILLPALMQMAMESLMFVKNQNIVVVVMDVDKSAQMELVTFTMLVGIPVAH